MIPGGVYAALLWNRLPWPGNLFATIFLGVFMTISIGLIWKSVLLFQDLGLVKSFSGQMTTRPDGKRVAVFGKIYPLGEPFRAPFSGAEAVCCVWGVYYWRRSSGKNSSRSKQYVANGHVLVPSSVRSPTEDIKLLGFPNLAGFPTATYEDAAANPGEFRNGAEYLKNLPATAESTFEKVSGAFSEIEDLMTDSDGTVRKEVRSIEAEQLSDGYSLEEQCLLSGAEICLMGKWSAEQRGILPEEMGTGKEITIRKGTSDQVASGLRKGIAARVIGGLIVGAIVNTVVWLLLHNFPAQ